MGQYDVLYTGKNGLYVSMYYLDAVLMRNTQNVLYKEIFDLNNFAAVVKEHNTNSLSFHICIYKKQHL